MEQTESGPFCYQNWKAQLSDYPWNQIWEYPLFSDAHFVGEITDGIGPYRVINAVHMGSSRPALVLRIKKYREYPMPQMDKTQEQYYHGGSEADEVASLLALCLGVRLKSGDASRMFAKDGDPMGRPIGSMTSNDPSVSDIIRKYKNPILQNVLGTHYLTEISLLSSLPVLSVANATAVIRAARMYQEAVWIVETTPELSWIMLTSAVETVAQQWRAKKETTIERMRTSRPSLEGILREFAGARADELVLKVANEIAPYMGATRSFVDFLVNFLPPPPAKRPLPWAQVSWDTSALRKVMTLIYKYRSRALHGGHPFPAPMCEPLWEAGEHGELAEIPPGLATSMKGGVWMIEDTPILLNTFEYIARNAMLNWWKSIVPENDTHTVLENAT